MERNPEFLRTFMDQDIYIIPDEVKNDTKKADPMEDQPVAKEPEITYSGSFSSRNIIIIEQNASPDDLALLDKILSSVSLSRENVALITDGADLTENIDQLGSLEFERLISFGVTSGKTRFLDIQTKYSPATVEDRTVMICDPLNELVQSTELKRKLWECLKKVFS